MNYNEWLKNIPTEAECQVYLETFRWNGVPTCPYCQFKRSIPLPQENRYHCKKCRVAYSVKVGTLFQDSRLPLQKWFLAIAIMLNPNRKFISGRRLAKYLDINKDTGCRLTLLIEQAMYEFEQRQLLLKIADLVQQQTI